MVMSRECNETITRNRISFTPCSFTCVSHRGSSLAGRGMAPLFNSRVVGGKKKAMAGVAPSDRELSACENVIAGSSTESGPLSSLSPAD